MPKAIITKGLSFPLLPFAIATKKEKKRIRKKVVFLDRTADGM